MTKVAFRSEWSKTGVIDKLLSELNSGTKLNSDGAIQFTAHDHRDLFYLLADAITYPGSITRRDVSAISYRSFIDLRRLGLVNRKKLISEISIAITNIESMPNKRFTMWTKCRLSQMNFVKGLRFKVDGVLIRTSSHLPKWLRLEEHFLSGFGRINPNDLPFFGYFIISTDARNENEGQLYT